MPDFQLLYDQHYSDLVRKATSHYKLRDDDAEQAAIDALMDLYSALAAGRAIESHIALLYYQLRLHVIDIQRSAIAFRKLKIANMNLEVAPACDAVDARDAITAIWPELNPTQQQIVCYVYLLGDTQREAAEKLGISVSTLEKQLARLRKRLHTLLTKATA